MDSDQLLQSLGLDLGLPNLRFDDNGCARLAIEGAPALNFERDANGSIHLYSVLCPQPPEGREALYAQLLQGNLFGTSTAGASLAIDEVHREVVLCRTISADLATAPAFIAEVEAFVAAAEDWQARLAGPGIANSTLARAPASPMMDHFLRG
ncbi:MAG TPA: type III secretion system chaperone [Ramlibacter sp.]|jgi:hypothetical protein|nr:type III secretion system chaperone [Ramlibacter sp.]